MRRTKILGLHKWRGCMQGQYQRAGSSHDMDRSTAYTGRPCKPTYATACVHLTSKPEGAFCQPTQLQPARVCAHRKAECNHAGSWRNATFK